MNIHYYRRGFNLVELMTTVTVASILLAIGVPALNSVQLQIRAKSNISTIQHSLKFARNMAINYGARVTVCPLVDEKCSTDWRSGYTIFLDTGISNQLDTEDTILKQISPFHANDIVQYNRKAVRFLPDGLASGTNGTLTYCPEIHTSPYSKAVIVNQAGRVRYSTKKLISCKK
ncbi:GspH/FimT family pseudopilin [Shewanella sp. 4_MG-2023]|uniref:GspH/FimT family pseudopilin n=1 Tax=Shewanella sp. 4_MG-2023 TaxID=3062652 RepID=UPI0026E343EE|nr:GspH/FimT family pseudopilin [Shewanella sp. 4_MG-2023]MDO6679816.1 GspH/FimT family pseudopilin [Shewanella sp. 4_MG-2023]